MRKFFLVLFFLSTPAGAQDIDIVWVEETPTGATIMDLDGNLTFVYFDKGPSYDYSNFDFSNVDWEIFWQNFEQIAKRGLPPHSTKRDGLPPQHKKEAGYSTRNFVPRTLGEGEENQGFNLGLGQGELNCVAELTTKKLPQDSNVDLKLGTTPGLSKREGKFLSGCR